MGLVAGPASSPMSTRKQNVRSRRRRALGWPGKTGPVAGPTESPLATRPGSSSRRAASVQMATVLALGGAIVYHDGDVRTTARRATGGHMARRVVSWGQRKIVTKRCTRAEHHRAKWNVHSPPRDRSRYVPDGTSSVTPREITMDVPQYLVLCTLLWTFCAERAESVWKQQTAVQAVHASAGLVGGCRCCRPPTGRPKSPVRTMVQLFSGRRVRTN